MLTGFYVGDLIVLGMTILGFGLISLSLCILFLEEAFTLTEVVGYAYMKLNMLIDQLLAMSGE